MITELQFKNFKVLRDATLKLGPFNLLVGPNGSGKSTVFRAFELGKHPQQVPFEDIRSVGGNVNEVDLGFFWSDQEQQFGIHHNWIPTELRFLNTQRARIDPNRHNFQRFFNSIQVFAFEPAKIAATAPLTPNTILAKDGANLVGALDNLRDQSEEAFDSLKAELREWLPEFDSILFDTPSQGQRSLRLRQTSSKGSIRSVDLSEGTLISLALLYLVHHPRPPQVICLEEPDRGLHPRLLRDLRDALYRLTYPKRFGLDREPVQVIATTHSPYFLDLFRDSPEEIVIAEKQPDASSKFKRLSDDKKLIELIGDCSLGEVWYSGVLGGVPIRPK